MNGKYLLDTNAIINILNGFKHVFKSSGSLFSISIITEIEVLSFPGLNPDEIKSIKELFKKVEIINISDNIKEEAIRIRMNYKFKLPDSIITATALCDNFILVTDDKKLFRFHEIPVIPLKEL